MVNLQTIVALNSSAILLLLIVFLNLRVTIHYNSPDNKLFYIMSATTIAQAVIETIAFFIEGVSFTGAYWLNVVVNDLLFINNAVFAYMWVLYVDSKLFDDFKQKKKRHIIMGIPAGIIITASIANLFIPVFFSVDKVTLRYSRTDIYFIPMLSITFYLLYGLFLTLRYRSRNERFLFFSCIDLSGSYCCSDSN
ncbi:MAG: hypothetical protein Q4F95_03045 [Oscillospiraceae bacterium]|nr:hypothetical protein [Oscillospiraceae bacterium]